ncbi:MAG: guanylate kinase [Candidatus Sericytochromatia bacterium]
MSLNSINKYHQNWKLKKPHGFLIVVSGPSGVGKGTIVKEVINNSKNIVKSVSITTRKPRENEVEGEDYFFRSIEEFSELIDNDSLLEYACVFGGKLYGTPKAYVEEQISQGKDVILEIDVQGAMQVKKRWPHGIFIFILPPTLQELERRLRDRNTEDEEAIRNRLAVANKEFESIPEYDYLIINDDLKESVDFVKSIIYSNHCNIKNLLMS